MSPAVSEEYRSLLEVQLLLWWVLRPASEEIQSSSWWLVWHAINQDGNDRRIPKAEAETEAEALNARREWPKNLSYSNNITKGHRRRTENNIHSTIQQPTTCTCMEQCIVLGVHTTYSSLVAILLLCSTIVRLDTWHPLLYYSTCPVLQYMCDLFRVIACFLIYNNTWSEALYVGNSWKRTVDDADEYLFTEMTTKHVSWHQRIFLDSKECSHEH